MINDNANNPSPNAPPMAKADSISWPDIRTQSQLQKTSNIQLLGDHIYPSQGSRIGEILKALGVIDDKILEGVEKRHHTKKAKDKPTGELLVYMGIIEKEVLTRALCIQAGVMMVDLNAINIPYDFLKLVSNDNAREKMAVPVGVYNGILYIAVADPLSFQDQHFFSFSTGLKIKPILAPKSQIITCLNTKWVDPGSEIWAG